MALIDSYVLVPGLIPEFFKKIQEGQAPSRFTQQLLKDIGFSSTNHRAFIPLLKALGFLSPDGAPTKRYHEYRDISQSKRVMADALREAYGDLFVIKAQPKSADRGLIEGKFKSTHNITDQLAKRMATTFFALLPLADLEAKSPIKEKAIPKEKREEQELPKEDKPPAQLVTPPSLHYNIQIHLPATKDIEVFNAIFKSLKDHLLE